MFFFMFVRNRGQKYILIFIYKLPDKRKLPSMFDGGYIWNKEKMVIP